MINNATATDAELEKLATAQAYIQLTQNSLITEVMGTHIYGIKEGWEIRQLKKAYNLPTVISVAQLREAMKDTSVVSMFIPAQSALHMESVKKILVETAKPKNIFWEQ
ncbi:MAG: hypothetical protein MK052_03480 [Alphaproteobacteria bacterium]|nr:hypothetical protein [Alphaproteobacteria bacterium]